MCNYFLRSLRVPLIERQLYSRREITFLDVNALLENNKVLTDLFTIPTDTYQLKAANEVVLRNRCSRRVLELEH